MKSESKGAVPATYTVALSREQAEKLRVILGGRGWEFAVRPYMLFFAQGEKVSVAVYEKGPKVVVQGKGAEEFVQFVLEPEVLGGLLGGELGDSGGGVARVDGAEQSNPEWFTPHIGVDESGKGDFFGPLVIAGVYVDREVALTLRAAGVQDSKNVGTDAKIRQLAKKIREISGVAWNVVLIRPERYNELYAKFNNLNRLLAWGHARVIENVLEKCPDCPRALSDQFANPILVKRALMERGRGIELEQRTKAESDPAVAAASILARETFVNWMDERSKEEGVILPRGASAAVKVAGREIVAKKGVEGLGKVAKMHFRTANEIITFL